MIKKKIFSQDPREQVKIDTMVKNLSDPINDLICSHCLLYTNCSAHCEHIEEIYARIGREFYDKEYIYQPNLMSIPKRRDMIVKKMTDIINEYLKEKEICYGTERDV